MSDFEVTRTPSKFEHYSDKIIEFTKDHAELDVHQRKALMDTKTHFEEDEKACVYAIGLPTGSSPLPVIALLPYYLACKKALIIAPTAAIVGDITNECNTILTERLQRSEKGARRARVQMLVLPSLLDVESRVGSAALAIFDVHKLRPRKRKDGKQPSLCGLPSDFDLVIIADRVATQTRKDIVAFFQKRQAKIVLFMGK